MADRVWLGAFYRGPIAGKLVVRSSSLPFQHRRVDHLPIRRMCPGRLYAVVPIIQAGGLGIVGVSRLRLVVTMAAFPLMFALSYFLLGRDFVTRANGSRNVLYRGLLVVSRIPLHWLRGWRLTGLWLWRYVLRWWRGAPLILAVLSGIYIAAGDYPTADILAKSAIVSLIPAAFWPRRPPKHQLP